MSTSFKIKYDDLNTFATATGSSVDPTTPGFQFNVIVFIFSKRQKKRRHTRAAALIDPLSGAGASRQQRRGIFFSSLNYVRWRVVFIATCRKSPNCCRTFPSGLQRGRKQLVSDLHQPVIWQLYINGHRRAQHKTWRRRIINHVGILHKIACLPIIRGWSPHKQFHCFSVASFVLNEIHCSSRSR